MRFQQLNRDPNTVMRKKLVKSKKNWVVVSSLSIAGGLFLLGAPSYVAKAATTTDAVQQQTVVTPTPSDSGTTSAPVTDGSTNTSSPDNGATGSTTDGTKKTVASGSEGTNTPTNGTDDNSATSDSTTNSDGTGNNGTETKNGEENTQNQPQAQAFSAEATPVVEDTSAPTNSGNGWSYDSTSKTLTINGKLDEGNGSYQEDRWGGNTADITTIKTVEGAIAPVDSSYLFANMTSLTSTNSDFSHLDTSNTTNAEGMFTNDINLTTPDFSNNDFSKMENISHMFENDHGLLTIQLGGDPTKQDSSPFKNIVNGSYAFADCEKLSDFIGPYSPQYSSTNGWYVKDNTVANLISMFKNDKSLQVIQLTTWGWKDGTETGDSSIGEGMFDGTNLASIKISAALKFNPKTALTSNKGIKWTDTTFGQTFSGVPTFDDNGNPTGGLGSVYTGKDTTQLQGKDDLKNKFLVWNASGVPDSTTQVSNLVTIHTTHDGITSDITTTANGTWNSTVYVKVPSPYSFDPNKSPYVTSVETVPVVLGFTEATAADTVPYTPAVAKSGNVSVKTSNGTSIDIPVTAADTDTIGDTKTVTVTNDQIKKLVPGYHLANDAESTDVDVTFISPTTDNPDITGTSTSTIELVGDTTPENDKGSVYTQQGANNVSVPITIPAGTIGTPVKDIPINVDGYKTTTVTATTNVVDGKNVVTYTDKDGNVIDSDNPLVLEGNPVDENTGSINTTQGTNKNVSVPVTIPAGTIGTPVKDIPINVDGYKPTTVTATTNVVNGKNVTTYTDKGGNVIDNEHPLVLEGNPVDENSGSINTTQGTNKNVAVTVTVPAGTIGTPSDPIDINVDGYKTTTVTATTNVVDGKNVVTYTDKDGNVIDNDHPLVLEGNPINENTNGSVPTSQGNVTVTVPAGTVGTPSDPITVHVDGYKDQTVLATTDGKGNVTYTTNDGKNTVIDSTHPLALEGNPVKSQKITIPATAGHNDNTQEVTIKGGKVGDTEDITLNGEPGYTAPTVTVTYGPNNTFTIVDKETNKPVTKEAPAKYIGTPNKEVTITFTNPDGTTTTKTIEANTYNFGDDIPPVNADPINGYTAPSVLVTLGTDGTATLHYASDPNKTVLPTDKLTYTPIPTSSGNTDNQENSDIEYKNQTISTYADKPAVELYQLGQNGKMTLVTNRSLATATDWQSDAVITVDGVGYYRVSTNEWAKMSQAYPYTAPNVYVRAYSDSAKPLYKAESDLIKNRSLAANSSWIADHQTYVINGTKHYRVSTNEFVDEKDVYEYTPVNEIVTTHSGSSARLYTAKGDLVSNRSLSAHSSWKTDSITTINGEQYYRVSTNEFVKAADVDVNH